MVRNAGSARHCPLSPDGFTVGGGGVGASSKLPTSIPESRSQSAPLPQPSPPAKPG